LRRWPSTIGNYSGMGALTPDEAAQTAMPKSTISSRAGFQQVIYDNTVQAAASGNFYGYQGTFEKAFCEGGVSAPIAGTIVRTGTSAFAAIAPAIAALGPIAPFAAIGAAVVNLFMALFGHHSRMVKKEHALFCATLPAARDTLTAIKSGVSSGSLSPADGIAALQSLQQQFEQQLSSMLKMNETQCNAECVWIKQFRAIVAYLSSKWQEQTTAQAAASPAASAQATVTQAAAKLGVPSWALYGGAAAVLLLLLK